MGKVQPPGSGAAYTMSRLSAVTKPVQVSIKHAPLLLLPTLSLLAIAAGPATAQTSDLRNRVVAVENVRYDYAQVLNVEPVFQTLRATRTEQRCDEVPVPKPERPVHEESRWNKVVSSVRGWFGGEDEADAPPVAPPTSTVKVNCRVVPVEREFQRPIAYDVDYIYKGVKYRSRLAEDPGNRLRIRISVVPYVAPAQATASGP